MRMCIAIHSVLGFSLRVLARLLLTNAGIHVCVCHYCSSLILRACSAFHM
jgi:hypothetical protein